MPKKMTPKSQAKKLNPISTIPIFSYFLTLKKYHANKYTILNYTIMLHTLNYQPFCVF